MTEFIITPTNAEYINTIYRDPITGKWTIPVITFSTKLSDPYGLHGTYSRDPLNDDPKYQKMVIEHFFTRLVEKWLYKDDIFKKLHKYFIVEKDHEKGHVTLVRNVKYAKDRDYDKTDRKHINRYIEKLFITKRFIDKILRRYVEETGMKWYDVFHNTKTIKKLFYHKLKQLIVSTIYDLEDDYRGDREDREDREDSD